MNQKYINQFVQDALLSGFNLRMYLELNEIPKEFKSIIEDHINNYEEALEIIINNLQQ